MSMPLLSYKNYENFTVFLGTTIYLTNFYVVYVFSGDSEILTYFYGPVGVLLVLNIVLFAMTTWELTCGLWKREMVKTTSER